MRLDADGLSQPIALPVSQEGAALRLAQSPALPLLRPEGSGAARLRLVADRRDQALPLPESLDMEIPEDLLQEAPSPALVAAMERLGLLGVVAVDLRGPEGSQDHAEPVLLLGVSQRPLRLDAFGRAGLQSVILGTAQQLQRCAERCAQPRREQQRRVRSRLRDGLSISPEGSFAAVLMEQAAALLDLIPADGLALVTDGRVQLQGRTPLAPLVSALATHITRNWAGQVMALRPEASSWPEPPPIEPGFAVLALPVSRAGDDLILWFRQAGTAPPWSEADLAVARALRLTMIELVVERLEQTLQEREQSRRRQDLMLAEMDHRIKNVFANILALLLQSAHRADSLEGFVTSLQNRISSLAQTHSLLTQSRWQGASLVRLLQDELAAHQDPATERIRLIGPALTVRPKAALALSLAIHELATNAAKYGALSVPEGRVTVSWSLDPDSATAGLELEWVESGGPPVVAPSRRGFGRVVIERSLAYEVDGETRLSFDPSGVRCSILVPRRHLVLGMLGAEAEAAEHEGVTAAHAVPPLPSGARILLVEDSALVTMLAETLLKQLGMTVIGPCSRLEQALRLAATEPLDAALLDVDLNGVAVFPAASLLEERGIPFAFITGYSDELSLPPALRDRPRIIKPYTASDLAEVLADLLQRRPLPEPEQAEG